MRKIILVLTSTLLVLGLVIGSFGCKTTEPEPTTTPTQTSEVYTLRFSSRIPDTHPDSQLVQQSLDRIEELSNGRLIFDRYFGGTLFKAKAEYDGVNSGAADMAYVYTGHYPTLAPTSLVFEIPFACPDIDAMFGSIGKDPEILSLMQPEWAVENVMLLSIFPSPPYDFATNKRLVKEAEDLKGLKLRVPSATVSYWLELLGAAPAVLSIDELYMALKLGTLDGAVANWNQMLPPRNMNEVTKYYTWGPTHCVNNGFIVNKASYDSLPADLQELLSHTMRIVYNDLQLISTYQLKDDLQTSLTERGFEVYSLSADELSIFSDLAAPTKDWAIDELGMNRDAVERILDILKEYR